MLCRRGPSPPLLDLPQRGGVRPPRASTWGPPPHAHRDPRDPDHGQGGDEALGRRRSKTRRRGAKRDGSGSGSGGGGGLPAHGSRPSRSGTPAHPRLEAVWAQDDLKRDLWLHIGILLGPDAIRRAGRHHCPERSVPRMYVLLSFNCIRLIRTSPSKE
jgi:hypothetical protein